jgi:hypothetical protein
MNTRHPIVCAISAGLIYLESGCTTQTQIDSSMQISMHTQPMIEVDSVATANRDFYDRSYRASLLYKRAALVLSTENWKTVTVLRSALSGVNTNAFSIDDTQNRFSNKQLANCNIAVVMVPQARLFLPGKTDDDPMLKMEKALRHAGARRVVFITVEYGVFLVEFPLKS